MFIPVSLLKKYENTPEKITLPDVFLFVRGLLKEKLSLPKACAQKVRRKGEAEMPIFIEGVCCVRPTDRDVRDTVVLTVGVHGNEIYAGVLCALEVLNQQQNGTLNYNVVIQLGNVEAIKGYMSAYEPDSYFLDRNGWRETNGIEGEITPLDIGGNKSINVSSDFNRIPSTVLSLPRGLHANIDRAQDLLWLHRLLIHGFVISNENTLVLSDRCYSIKLVLSPHTSRMVGGIQNLSFPPRVMDEFKRSKYNKQLSSLPFLLKNLLYWTGNGLGGEGAGTFDSHVEKEYLNNSIDESISLPLIMTVEFGNHENIKPEDKEGLVELCGPAIQSLLDVLLDGSPMQEEFNSDVRVMYANPNYLDVSCFQGAENLEEGDEVYLVCESETVTCDQGFVEEHFDRALFVDDSGVVNVTPLVGAKKLSGSRLFYAMPRLELDFIRENQIVMLAFGSDKKVKYLTAPYDLHAIFTGDARLHFPQVNKSKSVLSEKVFFAGTAQDA